MKKGQLLFTIDDQPYRAKLAQAKGELPAPERPSPRPTLDVKRFKPLVAQRAISQAELDNALAPQRSAKAQVDAAQAELREGPAQRRLHAASPRRSTAWPARRERKVGRPGRQGGADAPHHRLGDRPRPRHRQPPRGALPQVREPAAGVGGPLHAKPTPSDRGPELLLGDGSRLPGARPAGPGRPRRGPAPPARSAPTSPSATRRGSSAPASTRRCSSGGDARRARCWCRRARSPSCRGPVLGAGGERRRKAETPHGEAGPARRQPLGHGARA